MSAAAKAALSLVGATAQAPDRSLISLRDACVHYGQVCALNQVSLHIDRGECVALVGANGSGKTSLLRLLNGLVKPSAGRRETGSAGDQPLVSAMLFQRPFLLHLSVRHNLLLALWLAGVPAAQRAQRCEDALARVGLAAMAARPARALSGGQQQRLALARAWGVRPDILFLDEPTASLDPSAKREVEALIHDFSRAGMTLVMSSHNLGQVRRLASRVLYLDSGRLLADRPVERFFDDPALPSEAAQFLKGELPWI